MLLLAKSSLFQGEGEVVAQVCAAPRSTSPTAEDVAEAEDITKMVEDISEVAPSVKVVEIEALEADLARIQSRLEELRSSARP